MAQSNVITVFGTIVEDEVRFTLVDLSRACSVDKSFLIGLVDEGVLEPEGDVPDAWRFGGEALRRARTALRIGHDLELSAAGTALVLDLLDEIDALKAKLRRTGAR